MPDRHSSPARLRATDVGDHVVPRLARGRGERDRAVRDSAKRRPRVATRIDQAVPAAIGDDDVRAAAQDQRGQAARLRPAQRLDDGVVVGGLDEVARVAAQLQRRQRRERDVVADGSDRRRHRVVSVAVLRDRGREQPRVRVDRELGVGAERGREHRAVGDPEVLELVVPPARVDHRAARIARPSGSRPSGGRRTGCGRWRRTARRRCARCRPRCGSRSASRAASSPRARRPRAAGAPCCRARRSAASRSASCSG